MSRYAKAAWSAGTPLSQKPFGPEVLLRTVREVLNTHVFEPADRS